MINCRKVLSLAGFSTTLSLAACCAVGQEPGAGGITQSTTLDQRAKTDAPAPLVRVRYETVARTGGAASALNDVYLRLLANPPYTSNSVVEAEFDQKRFGSRVWDAIKNYTLKTDQVVLAGVSGTIGGQPFGKRSLILINPSDTGSPAYADHFLTPYFRLSDSLELSWETSNTVTSQSHLASILVTTLQEVSKIYAPNGLLFKSISGTTDLANKMNKVDQALDKAFSTNERKAGPLTSIDPATIDHFDVYYNDNPKPVIVVSFDYKESLLSTDGKASSMPTRVSEILGKPLADNMVVSKLIEGDTPLYDNLKKNTADGYSEFCRGAGQRLATKGYNIVDRAAILYSYLSDSQWNNTSSMRKDPDICDRETSEGLKLTSLSLNSLDAIQVQTDAKSVAARKQVIAHMNKRKNGIWATLSPMLVGPTKDNWSTFANDTVSFVSVKYDLQLTDKVLLKAGVPTSLSIDEARDVLLDAKLKYDKTRALADGVITDKCYSVQNTQTSSFRGFCFYPRNGVATKPITIEFDFDSNFSTSTDDDSPSLNTMKFFPVASGIPQ